eukprot:TRINITY_DN21504_c0_g1_i1.p1 TRINITY_DN21504_c0_g1~~TRINITY_DN21504_c0_g1_i1.p1  ORF type:complete len:753 (+),score=260.79 TRINITY_DN21504_c0_g1_i1:464-2722(+)
MRSPTFPEKPKPASLDDATEGLMSKLPYGESIGSAVVGFLTGFLGSMAGVGGGPFCVPLLGWLIGLGHKQCVGTSILCGLTTLTVGGITTFLSSGSLDISLVPISVLAAVAPVFGWISAKMSNNISPLVLKQIFAGFLLLTSLQIVWGLAYSPTGAEGHWQYHLDRQSHVYEIEANEGQLFFRTQNFGGVLKSIKETGPPLGQKVPEGYSEGWFTDVSVLEGQPSEGIVRTNGTRGIMWVRVLDRGQSMETSYNSLIRGSHWNKPVKAQRKKVWYASYIAEFVSSLPGNVAFHLVIAVTAGCASGLLGIAGGSVVVPLMSLADAFQWQVITTTSLLSMIPTSLTTCYTHHLNGNVALRLAPGLVSGTVIGAFTGSKLMAVTSEVVRRSSCAGVLLLTALIMLYQGTKHLFKSTRSSKPSVVKLGIAVVFFYCLGTLLQEKVFNLPEFSHEYLLTLLQNVVVCVLSFYDLNRTKKPSSPTASDSSDFDDGKRKTPVTVYIILALLGTFGALCANRATRFLDYSSAVLMRSTKLQWIMLWRVFFLNWKRRPGMAEWVCGTGISVGLWIFTLAGVRVMVTGGNEGDFQIGVISMLASLACEATLYSLEEGVIFGKYRADKHELMMYLSGMSIPVNLFFLMQSGSLTTGWLYLQSEWRFSTLVVAFAFCNYIGTKYVLQIMQEYDSSMAVICTSIRKVFTVIIAFTLFPRAVTIWHLIGLGMVFGSGYGYLQATDSMVSDRERGSFEDVESPPAKE